MAKSMFDFINHVSGLLESVDEFGEWERELDKVRDDRSKSMADYALAISGDFQRVEIDVAQKRSNLVENAFLKSGINAIPIDKRLYPKRTDMNGPFRYRTGEVLYFDPARNSYYDSDAGGHISISEAKELMGVYALDEDENRSDSEVAVFFDDRDTALSAYRVAQQLGLSTGEVTYDATVDPKYGLGRYAVRLAPHVRITKPEQTLAFLESLYAHIDNQDLDQFEWLLVNQANLSEAATDTTKRKVRDQQPYDPMPRHNVYHDPDTGKFSSKSAVKGKKRGSASFYWDDKREKEAGVKRGGLQFKGSKMECGRLGRITGTYYKCSDGTKSYGGVPASLRKK
jgi:hypothetical protein